MTHKQKPKQTLSNSQERKPMIINDLNYLEISNEEVVGGYYDAYANKDADIDLDVDQDFDVDIDLDIDKNVTIDADSTVDATGNFGSLTFDVTVIGNNGFGEADVALTITDGLVEAGGTLSGGVA
ncbi:MAG: hypothetical protein QNJ51_08020 [Calothrix sp. MO_167.B12]|nr:hypothetical protein [Calothrix sp. MO_167.B12]